MSPRPGNVGGIMGYGGTTNTSAGGVLKGVGNAAKGAATGLVTLGGVINPVVGALAMMGGAMLHLVNELNRQRAILEAERMKTNALWGAGGARADLRSQVDAIYGSQDGMSIDQRIATLEAILKALELESVQARGERAEYAVLMADELGRDLATAKAKREIMKEIGLLPEEAQTRDYGRARLLGCNPEGRAEW